MMSDWTIEPYVGAGPLKFGMSPAEVAEILGPPESTSKISASFALAGQDDMAEEFKDRTTEVRIGADKKTILPKLDYVREKLVSIDVGPATKELELNGTKLFKLKPKERIEHLIESSGTVFQSFNGYIFLDYGLNMASAENARSNPTICVFATGEFDSLIKDDIEEDMGRYIKGGAVA